MNEDTYFDPQALTVVKELHAWRVKHPVDYQRANERLKALDN